MSKTSNRLPKEFVQKVKNIIAAKKSLTGEINFVHEDGRESWFQNSVMPILDEDGVQIGEVIVRYDITDKKSYEKLSITDPLTELYNRRYFNEILDREINRATREHSILSFIIMDIDYFKKYNDSYGHSAGDDALIAVANAIKKTLHRGSDFAFRLGGEEFGILFSGLTHEESLAFAEEIRTNVEQLQIPHANSSISHCITVSLGLLVIDFAEESVDANGFYTMADSALYKAKENGRNQVVIHQNENLDFF